MAARAGAGRHRPGDRAGGWLPYLEGVYQRQWEEQIAPYWSGLADFAAAQSPELRVCIELHPGTCVFNVETFGRVASLGPALAANLDPSHFFWMGMDGHKVAAALGDRIGHVHGKDTVFHEEQLGVGYGSSFANQAADLLEGWPDEPWSPGFRDGATVQAVCDAMESSAASGRWVSVAEVIASPLDKANQRQRPHV